MIKPGTVSKSGTPSKPGALSKPAAVFAAISLLAVPVFAQTAPANPVHEACHEDVDRICPDGPRGTEGAKKCIKENYDKLSDGCKAALAKARASAPPAETPK